MNKKAQVTIYVIVAILIVAAILILFFVVNDRNPLIEIGEEFDPEPFLDRCFKNAIRNTASVILPQGGFANPKNFKVYKDTKITYICQNINFYEPCIMQHPVLFREVEKEIEKEIEDDLLECFIEMDAELTDRNYRHQGSGFTYDVLLKPSVTELKVNRDFTFTKGEVTKAYSEFNTVLNIPIYDLVTLAQEIAAQEARFCYFEYVGFNILYPRYDVRKWVMSDSTEIYTIKDKQSGAEINIAVRGCAVPAGFGL